MSSSSAVPQYHSNVSVLCQLIGREKVDTSLWLRAEMLRLVDPMLESLFLRLIMSSASQPSLTVSDLCRLIEGEKEESNRLIRSEMDRLVNSLFLKLTNKLLLNIDLNRSGEAQPSTFNSDFLQPHSIGDAITDEDQYEQEILTEVKRELEEGEHEIALENVRDNSTQRNQFHTRPSSTDHHHLFHEMDSTLEDGQFVNQLISDDHQPNGQVNNATQQDWDELEIVEGDDKQMMHIEDEEEGGDGETEIDSDCDEEDKKSSNPPMNTASPPNQSSVMRQSARLAKRKQTEDKQPNEIANGNSKDVDGSDAEEDDCEEEVTSRSVKRPRPVNPTTLTSARPKQFITLTLQCPQVGCELKFAQDKLLTKHMWYGHSIERYRCLVIGCKESFTNSSFLSQHRAQSHQSTTKWHCDKCDHQLSTYRLLSAHNNLQHQLGHFQCAFRACTFTGEYKAKVCSHFNRTHRHTFNCPTHGCRFQTPNATELKRHQRTHSGIKPYRCKWPRCDFSATQRNSTIAHIRRKHLAQKPSTALKGAQLYDACDFVEDLDKS